MSAGAKTNVTNKTLTSSINTFLHSSRGRNFVGVASTIGVIAASSGYMAAHTVLLQKYREQIQLYKSGFPVKVSSYLSSLVSQVSKDMNLSERKKSLLSYFHVYGFDLYCIGSLNFRTGGMIGLSKNLSYKETEDLNLDKQTITVDNREVEWNSEHADLLKKSLLLSENAKKFAIAREISYLDTYYVYIHSLLGATCLLGYSGTTMKANDKLLGFHRPRSFRIMVYSFVGLFCWGLWAAVTDKVNQYYDDYIDKTAGSLSIEYAKGGVEFYSKILQRNMGLRGLLGERGEKYFTFFGNDVELLRQKHIPYSTRKYNMEKLVEKFSQEYGG